MKKTLLVLAVFTLCLGPVAELAQAEGTLSTSAAVAGFFGKVAVSSSVPTRVGTLNAGRKSVTLQNSGPNPIYCAPGSMSGVGTSSPTPVAPSPALTTSNGLPVQPGGTLAADLGSGIPLYCLAGTADQVSPADTRYWEFK